MRRSRRSFPRPTTARNGIFHPVTGETIAQGRYGLPVFLANMQFTVQNVIALANARRRLQARRHVDRQRSLRRRQRICRTCSSSRPYFADGELFALLASTGHWMDIGGSVPGGWAPKATEIHQEGIIIPPVKLYDEGKLNEAAGDDVPRQRAAAGPRSPAICRRCATSSRSAGAASTRWSSATAATCSPTASHEMIARSERQMRSYIAEISRRHLPLRGLDRQRRHRRQADEGRAHAHGQGIDAAFRLHRHADDARTDR